MDHKDTHKCHIEDDPLHQHPHEGDKEEVVEKDSYDLAVDRWISCACLVYASNKNELGYPQSDAQIHMDIAPHAIQRPGDGNGKGREDCKGVNHESYGKCNGGRNRKKKVRNELIIINACGSVYPAFL